MIKLESIELVEIPRRRCVLDSCWCCKNRKGMFCDQLKVQIDECNLREFVCEFYRRNNSGNFRRKIKKFKKGIPVRIEGYKGLL